MLSELHPTEDITQVLGNKNTLLLLTLTSVFIRHPNNVPRLKEHSSTHLSSLSHCGLGGGGGGGGGFYLTCEDLGEGLTMCSLPALFSFFFK